MSKRGVGQEVEPRVRDVDSPGTASTEGKVEDRVKTRRTLIEQEIYHHATRLFAERGFAGTNLQDIADAVGLTRPALYHYVSSKDELLARIVVETSQDAAESISQIVARDDLDPVLKVREVVRTNVVRQGQNSDRFQLLVRSEASLPAEVGKTHHDSRRSVLRSMTALVEEGIESGAFRPADARVVALGLLGMSNWVAWWYNAEHGDDLQVVSEELADLAVAGLVSGAEDRGPVGGPAAAIKTIRADLTRLESMLTD